MISKIINKLVTAVQRQVYNIVRIGPNATILWISLTNRSVIIDLGTGHDADFSQAMILKYGLRSFGFVTPLENTILILRK